MCMCVHVCVHARMLSIGQDICTRAHTHTCMFTNACVDSTIVKCMDDNCGGWVECMGVASGCGEQEAGVASGRGWNLWVWL